MELTPCELVPSDRTPDTIAGWKAMAQSLLSAECCAFHRNLEISCRYAWIHQHQPAGFKWAAMAAIASHHVRLALFPLRLDTDRAGYLDLSRSLGRRRVLLTQDVNTIRGDEQRHLRRHLLGSPGVPHRRTTGSPASAHCCDDERRYAAILSGFEAIDRGRRVLEDPTASTPARRTAADLIWAGNLRLLEHEQRAVVQPNFDLLSCNFARLISIGSATKFEAHGVRHEVAYFTSFYLYSMTRGIPAAVRAQAWPRITRFDDRWRWLVTSVVPRFRRFDDEARLVDATLQRIFDEARALASAPCMEPVGASATKSMRRWALRGDTW